MAGVLSSLVWLGTLVWLHVAVYCVPRSCCSWWLSVLMLSPLVSGLRSAEPSGVGPASPGPGHCPLQLAELGLSAPQAPIGDRD